MGTLDPEFIEIGRPLAGTNVTPARYVFTLVHGTWARCWLSKVMTKMSGSAQWYEDDSTFRSRLASDLPNSIFIRSDWSGGNSVTARLEAAKSLALDLKQRIIDYPDAHHFVIAHSHGGNIACYALRDNPDLAGRIAVIALSTPFLHAHSFLQPSHPLTATHDVQEKVEDHHKAGRVAMAVLMLFSVFVPVTIINLLGWDTPLPLVLLCSSLFYLVLPRELDIHEDIDLRLKAPQNLLIIRVAADEASVLLLFSQLGVWLGKVILMFIVKPLFLLNARVNGLPIVVRVLLCMALASFLFSLPNSPTSWTWGPLVVFTATLLYMYWEKKKRGWTRTNWLYPFSAVIKFQLILYGVFALLDLCLDTVILLSVKPTSEVAQYIGNTALVLVLILFLLTPLLTSLSMGFRYAFSYMFFTLAFEPAPPGIHTIHQFGIRGDLKDQIKTWLNHSIPYKSGEVIAAISAWIRNVTSKHT